MAEPLHPSSPKIISTQHSAVLNRPTGPVAGLTRWYSGLLGWTRQHWVGVALGAILVLGAVLRLYVLFKTHFIPDGDEALTGAMAIDILKGRFPIFTYGQAYMGAAEAYFIAPIFALFGASSWGMKMAPLAASLGVIALNYLVARRYLNNILAGLFAALFTALPSLYFLMIQLRAWNHYIETVLVGNLLLLVAYSIIWGPPAATEAPRYGGFTWREWLRWGLLGLVAGYGFYGHMIIVYYYLPVIFFLFLKDKLFALRPLALVTLAGFFLGSFPWWLYNLQKNWATIAYFTRGGGKKEAALDVLGHYQQYSWPLATGAFNYWFLTSLVIAIFLNVVYLGCLLGWLVARWRGLAGWFRLSLKPGKPVDLLLLFALFSPLIYVVWGVGNVAFTDLDTTGRYLLPLMGILPVLAGGGLAVIARWLPARLNWQTRPKKLLPLALAGLLLLGVAGSNLYMYRFADFIAITQSPYFPQLRPPVDNGPLIAYLKSQGIEYATCNHWVGHRIILDSAESIKCVDYNDLLVGGLDRFPEYSRAVLQPGQRLAFVLLDLDDGLPGREGAALGMENRLKALGVQYIRKDFEPYLVFIPTSRPVSPAEVVEQLRYPF